MERLCNHWAQQIPLRCVPSARFQSWMDVLFAGMPSAAHRVPACRRIHGRTRSLWTLSTRRRSPRHCQPDLVRYEFAASLTCTRHLRQADCSALSPRDALLSHDLHPQLRAPLSHGETRSSSHTLLPLCSLTARRSPHPSPLLVLSHPPSPSHPLTRWVPLGKGRLVPCCRTHTQGLTHPLFSPSR